MQLPHEESNVFWPEYNKEALHKINTDYCNIINEFADDFVNMNAEKA